MKKIHLTEAPDVGASADGIYSLLQRIKSALDGQRVLYWLDGGTALKVARDGHILSSDLDISSWQSEGERILEACEELRREGFRVKDSGIYAICRRSSDALSTQKLQNAIQAYRHRPVLRAGPGSSVQKSLQTHR